MSNSSPIGGVQPRHFALLAALGGVILACLLAGPVTKSYAVIEGFCINARLQPYGQSGDRCTAPNGGNIVYVRLTTNERAGCADIENNGTLLTSWTCYPSGTVNDTYYSGQQWAHGIIRNNNLSSAGTFTGAQFWQ